jgi:uncharacterized protein
MAPVVDGLTASDLRRVVTVFADLLREHRESINKLNVYPVPDGDTGTNMALTARSVVGELESADADMAATCRAIAFGALMGGRGNSGVILSQILRAATGRWAVVDAIGPIELATGLAAASDDAYGAVAKPVEGTILTVISRASSAATAAADAGASLVEVLDEAHRAGADALADTPNLLPVLARAGVVDAGGAGFLLLLDAGLHVVDGRSLPDAPAVDGAPIASTDLDDADGHGGDGELRYEVMYFLEADDAVVPAFRDVWAGLGDSIVVVGGDGLWNCHIHTDDIGGAIEAALDCGRPRRIRVTDLHEQIGDLEEEAWVRAAAAVTDDDRLHPVSCAVVAVASGEGLRRILHSLGVQRIVSGGQSMNPSVAQLVEAIDAVPADEVVVLPNNKNIVPVAERAAEVSAKMVRVIPTKGVVEGVAALVAYDPDAGIDGNVADMTAAVDGVATGEVTRAVRDSVCDAGPIREGDYLGIDRDGIEVIDASLVGAVTGLIDRLVAGEHELVTLIEGDGASESDTSRITHWLAETHPAVVLEVHHGGQPLYPYFVGVE